MSNLNKIFTIGLMIVTVFSMSVVVAPEVSAAASAGDLIKMDGLSSVYYLGADGKRYVFPNESTYFSWYSDFSGVVTIPQSELETYPLGANVTVRPGTKLVKITTNPKVYAVESNGTLMPIPDEATAKALYGDMWAKRVVDIADSFFTNYTISSASVSSSAYPEGSLVKENGGSTIYYINGSGEAQSIADESAFLANRFNWDDVITAAAGFTLPTMGTEISGSVSSIIDTSQGGGSGTGVVAGGGTGLIVALASDTPAAMSIPTGSAVEFLKFNLTASNDGDVKVSTIKLTAGGLGTATVVDSVTLYNNGQRVGNVKNVDSNNEAYFNLSTPVTVPAGGTKSILVKATVASGTGQHNLGIKSAADLITDGATVSGSFPVTGNTMSATSVTVGTLTMGDDGTPANIDLGDMQATLAKFKMTASSVEDIWFKSITLKRSAGTASDDDFENMVLVSGGSTVATSMDLNDKYVTFTLTTPMLIEKSQNKKFEVRGDIVDGAGKTFTLDLNNVVDVNATGDYFGQSVAVTDSFTGNSITIAAGAIAIAKTNAAMQKTRADQTDVELGTFSVTPNSGTSVELTTLKLTIDTVNEVNTASVALEYLENIEVNVNGAIYELTYTTTGSDSDTAVYQNTDMNLVMLNGATYDMKVRGDVVSSSTNQKYTVKIADASTDFLIRETENETSITDITPNSVTLKQKIVENPSVTFSVNALSAAYSAVIGSTDVEALSLNIEAGETDDIKVTELKFADLDADTISSSNISSLNLWKGTSLIKSKSPSDLADNAAGTVGVEEITFSDLTEVVSAGETNIYTLKIGLVNDSTNNGTSTRWTLSGYSAEDVTEGDARYDTTADSDSDGLIESYTSLYSARTITIRGSGTLYVSMDNTNTETNKAKYVIGGSNSGFLAAIDLRASNEDVIIDDILVGTDYSSLDSMVSKLELVDSDKSTVIGTETNISATTTFDNLAYTVGQTTQTIYLRATFNTIAKDAVGLIDASTTFRVANVTADGADSGIALADSTDGTNASGEIVYGTAYTTDYTASSNAVAAVGIRPSSVSLVNSAEGVSLASSLLVGWNKAAIIKVVASEKNDNTIENGDEMKLLLREIKVKISANSETTLGTNGARIKRLGSGFSGVASSTADALVAAADGDYVRFDLTQTEYATDDELSAGDTAYFLVEVNVSAVTATTDWIQVDLDNLDGTTSAASASGANFTWRDGSDSTTQSKYPLRLSSTSIDGTVIQEAI